jgi:TetR/AcrR family transcriptional repressor of mexCD-oprJ operon
MSEVRHHLESRQALQDRVSSVILDAAARVLAVSGQHASMSDVAVKAGVARATVYRYFPTRQALLDRLEEVAIGDARSKLVAARIDKVGPEEGVRRAVRALLDVGDYFVVVARERRVSDTHRFSREITGPLRRVLDRGQAAGDIRGDIPTSWMVETILSLVTTVVASPSRMGRDDTVELIIGLFFDGARGREGRAHRHLKRST